MKPLVALDCDGILSDWIGGVIDVVAEVTGRHYNRQEITTWNPWKTPFRLNSKEYEAVMEAVATPGFCESLQVLPGAQDGYDELRKVADVVVVTSPWLSSPTWAFERMKWLGTHFGIGPEFIIHTSAKQYVPADFFIDDHAANVRRWTERNGAGGYLYDASYNQGVSDMPRLFGWKGIVALVQGATAKESA